MLFDITKNGLWDSRQQTCSETAIKNVYACMGANLKFKRLASRNTFSLFVFTVGFTVAGTSFVPRNFDVYVKNGRFSI